MSGVPHGSAPPAGSGFAERIIAWQARHGRHDLPWQRTPDPYRIWVSEIMLQQTQVSAVIPYFHRFMDRFPDVAQLAAAPLDDVLALWSGLGYYARARNLHQASRQVVDRFGGRVPTTSADLVSLPGIGRSTAAAIAAFSCGERAAILDGNVKRVLARHFAIDGFPGRAPVEARLWALAAGLLPDAQMAAYTQGLMDLGATLCTRNRPRCLDCPLATSCRAHREDRVAELPSPRPRRARPERRGRAWLLRRDTLLFLERRPPSGIWGGLWSLPEALPDWALGARPTGRSWQIRHMFTHFTLDLAVEELRLPAPQALRAPVASTGHGRPERPADTAEEGGQAAWFAPMDTLDLGLPAPIRGLLQEVVQAD